MNESEPKQSNPNVEDGLSAKPDPVEEEKKEVKEEDKALKPIENSIRDATNIPEVVIERAADELDADADGDSEAETLIQSPEKKRNSVTDGSMVVHNVKLAGSDSGSIVIANTSDKENAIRKRKRSQEEGSRDSPTRLSSRHSSPLSSPVAHMQSDNESDDSDASDIKISVRQHDESDEPETLNFRKKRRRPSEAATTSSKRSKRDSIDLIERRETRSATYPRPSDDEKSPSPEPISRREHRRGASTQLITGEFERKKRGRPPLINTRRNRSADRVSNSSEESGPRTGRARPHLHKLTSHDHDMMSPAKVGPRKWKDKNGRTYLARACANNDLENARQRLSERVEDLNMEDNAGNTPLQIASLEGFEEIVEFLLSNGADVNVRNVDKDTPLIDAVENGHVEVVKLLLKYGANPRMGNAKGDEPYELVHPEDESYAEIRGLLAGAKDKDAKKTPGIDVFDMQPREGTASRAASAASPRDSPPTAPRSPPAGFNSRRRTGRSESTRNDLLWQANTQENLAKLAAKGDVQGVASILSILEKAETEALIAAAKAGHEEILQLLIAMGKPNPDPEPVRSSKLVPMYNTPILAAIGRGHPDVVKLLCNQSGFNPMRRYREKTYYELAEERKGDKWQEESSILKSAYERARGKKSNSPRKTRDMERTRPRRRSSSVASVKKQLPSPTSTHKSLPTVSSPRERRKVSDPTDRSGNDDLPESSLAVASDADQTVRTQTKTHRTRRSQSDLPPLIDNEPAQRRRRLVTGKEHRSRNTVDTSSDGEEDEDIEVKREERPNIALKRSRVSSTPDPPGENKDRKKRRTVLESSPDDLRPRPSLTAMPTPPIPSVEEEPLQTNTKNGDDSRTVVKDNILPLPVEPRKIELTHEPKEMTPPETDVNVADGEILPDAGDESDDHYSPPPAIEPPVEMETEQEEEPSPQELADRQAQEAAALVERQRQDEEDRREREAAAERIRRLREAEERRRDEEEAAIRRQQEEEEEAKQQLEETKKRFEETERERKRLEALPVLLARTAQMINEDDVDVRSVNWLSKFLPLYVVKTRQLDPHCNVSVADEEWVPNFQVAGLLSTKDLGLQSFGSLEQKPVSAHERQCLWRVARLNLSYDIDPDAHWTTSVSKANGMESIAQAKFMAMEELFWVKLSDFLNQVPHVTHLDHSLPCQPISLKSYTELLSSRMKTGIQPPHNLLANGIIAHTNGENGIT